MESLPAFYDTVVLRHFQLSCSCSSPQALQKAFAMFIQVHSAHVPVDGQLESIDRSFRVFSFKK